MSVTQEQSLQKPEVVCPICGMGLKKSSLSGHLIRSHNYYRRPRPNPQAVIQPDISQPDIVKSEPEVDSSKPESLVIVKTERKRRVKREVEKPKKVDQKKVESGKVELGKVESRKVEPKGDVRKDVRKDDPKSEKSKDLGGVWLALVVVLVLVVWFIYRAQRGGGSQSGSQRGGGSQLTQGQGVSQNSVSDNIAIRLASMGFNVDPPPNFSEGLASVSEKIREIL